MRGYLAILVLVLGCSHREDDVCQRAVDRIDRIWAARGKLGTSKISDTAVDECRHGKYAGYDPVMRCAMDSPTDEATAACMDAFANAVTQPADGKPEVRQRGHGLGHNPLLE